MRPHPHAGTPQHQHQQAADADIDLAAIPIGECGRKRTTDGWTPIGPGPENLHHLDESRGEQ